MKWVRKEFYLQCTIGLVCSRFVWLFLHSSEASGIGDWTLERVGQALRWFRIQLILCLAAWLLARDPADHQIWGQGEISLKSDWKGPLCFFTFLCSMGHCVCVGHLSYLINSLPSLGPRAWVAVWFLLFFACSTQPFSFLRRTEMLWAN